MPAAVTHLLNIVLGLLAIGLVWYYRLVVAPRIPAAETQRTPSHLRGGSHFGFVLTIILSILVGFLVLFELFLLVGRDPGDYGNTSTLIVLALFDLLFIALIVRIRQRIDRSARGVEP